VGRLPVSGVRCTERPKWESKGVSDGDWEQVTCTFGPYWQVLDPIAARLDSESLQQKIVSGANGGAAVELEGKAVQWRPYAFSWMLGTDRVDFNQNGFDGLGPVPPEFLVFNAVRGGPTVVRYLTTRVYSPREQELYFDFGGQDREPARLSWAISGQGRAPARQAWVNGEQVMDVKDRPLTELPKVKLKSGWNEVVLRLAQTPGRQLATFAVFHSQPKTPEQPRFMPLSRWYDIAPELIYDYQPEGQHSVGWYRFLAPPGAEQAKLNLVANSVEAWVDGESVKVVDDTISIGKSGGGATQPVHVALRVEHKPGFYAGAAFKLPVTFKCGRGQIPLGDWSDSGLDYYSGGLKYVHHFQLNHVQKSRQVLLDLGDVRTSAEVKVNGHSVGVRLAAPFVFDLTYAVQPGDNEIEVEVLNTLANYMSAGPSKYVYKGQTVSGLLGPVSVRMVPQVKIHCRPVQDARQPTNGGPG
jgi:hypothetical protein